MTYPDMPEPVRFDCGEVTLSVHLAGPEDGIPILLLHGWPDLALCWSDQIRVLAEAGYRVIAPDNRGFGASDAPTDIDAYAIDHLVGDLSRLLDALKIDQALMVGHDWGGILMWHAACLIPERFMGAVGVCTPHLPRGAQPPIEVFRQMAGDEHYIVRMQDEALDDFWVGQEEDFFAFTFMPPPPAADLEKLPASVTHLPKRFTKWTKRGGLKSEDDCVMPADRRQVYADAFARTGFRTGFNWYRNMDANWERMGGVDHRLSIPCLMISAECDFMLPPKLTRFMPALCKDVEFDILEETGHWVHYEAGEELNRILLDWLGRRFPA